MSINILFSGGSFNRLDFKTKFLTEVANITPTLNGPQYEISLYGFKHSIEKLLSAKSSGTLDYVSEEELEKAFLSQGTTIDIHPVTKEKFPRVDPRAYYYSLKEAGRHGVTGTISYQFYPYSECDTFSSTLPRMPMTYKEFCLNPTRSLSHKSIKRFQRPEFTGWMYNKLHQLKVVLSECELQEFNDVMWNEIDSIELQLNKPEKEQPFKVTAFDLKEKVSEFSKIIRGFKESLDNQIGYGDFKLIIENKINESSN